ncbi:maleate cis-trans isomerase family protein [Streptomyces sp. NBC_01361]|uniref:maleate cis-trans isomerase family protein n=1 Tax=Streptomyces sp. NBC_01361 TaxID=2903838 RepID=UPI002E358BB7|nr:decarboxylase [Streptomyces sp. NBC_01361]
MDITAFGGPVPQRGIGVVAPFDFALDRELWRWTPEEISLHLTRTPYVPVEVSVDMARLISEHETLQHAVTALDAVRPVSFAYACTSGSFVGGIAYERAMCASMSGSGRGMPSVTTSGALLEALQELGARRVSVITPYTQSLTDALADYLAEADIDVVSREYMGLTGEIWQVGYRDVVELARSADLTDADCLFISCTNLATYDVIPQLEAELRIPVISANQVTMWSALRHAGAQPAGDYQSLIDPAARAALAPYPRKSARSSAPSAAVEWSPLAATSEPVAPTPPDDPATSLDLG